MLPCHLHTCIFHIPEKQHIIETSHVYQFMQIKFQNTGFLLMCLISTVQGLSKENRAHKLTAIFAEKKESSIRIAKATNFFFFSKSY